MSLVGYRTHSITLRAANMRRGVLVNSAAARRFVFFTESAKYLLQKSGRWIKINPELKCRERCAGDGPRAPAIDEGNSQNRERNEKHQSNANTISAEESAVADSGGGHGSEPAADLGLRVG